MLNASRHINNAVNQFWFIPAVMSVAAALLAHILIWLEETYGVPSWLSFIYQGGESGARSLLSSMTSMSIGVAGTLFSITIAALSSVISSMGPRLLHSFVRDRGIQTTLGVFVATFVFSLYSLRAISAGDNGKVFVPHYNVTVSMLFAALCVGFLVYYIAHMAMSISMSRNVNLLTADTKKAFDKATEEAEEERNIPTVDHTQFKSGEPLTLNQSGYVQAIDYQALADYAAENDLVIKLEVKPGDFVVRGQIMGRATKELDDDTLDKHVFVGESSDPDHDVTYAVRQMVEVAVRALSPGTNDPYTATDVIRRLSQILAELEDRQLPSGVITIDDELRLVHDVVTFDELVDTMFADIRRNAAGTVVVYTTLLEQFVALKNVINDPLRVGLLHAHGEAVYEDATRLIDNERDLQVIESAYRRFKTVHSITGQAV